MEKDPNADHDDATRSVSSLSSNYRACFVRDSTGFRSNLRTLDAMEASARRYLDRRAKNRSSRAGSRRVAVTTGVASSGVFRVLAAFTSGVSRYRLFTLTGTVSTRDLGRSQMGFRGMVSRGLAALDWLVSCLC